MLLLFMVVEVLVLEGVVGVMVVVEVLVFVEVDVLVVLVFVLPVLVLSVAQPVQKAATASKAKTAKVLRIEFFSCNPTGQFLRVARGFNFARQPPQQLGQCCASRPSSQRLQTGPTESVSQGRLRISMLDV
jgi:hypothetical protein